MPGDRAGSGSVRIGSNAASSDGIDMLQSGQPAAQLGIDRQVALDSCLARSVQLAIEIGHERVGFHLIHHPVLAKAGAALAAPMPADFHAVQRRDQRQARPRHPARHRAGRNAQHVGGLGIGQAFDRHQHQRPALLRRQAGHEPSHIGQGQARLHRPLAVGPDQRVGIYRLAPARPDRRVPLAADPQAVGDLEHPALQPGAGLPLPVALDRPLVHRLDQIVRFLQRAGEPAREASQPRPQRQQCLPRGLLRPRPRCPA